MAAPNGRCQITHLGDSLPSDNHNVYIEDFCWLEHSFICGLVIHDIQRYNAIYCMHHCCLMAVKIYLYPCDIYWSKIAENGEQVVCVWKWGSCIKMEQWKRTFTGLTTCCFVIILLIKIWQELFVYFHIFDTPLSLSLSYLILSWLAISRLRRRVLMLRSSFTELWYRD